MSRDDRKQLGRWGEGVAATYLEAQGYRILERNWRTGRGEIDLVAKTGEEYVFVEVKTRRGQEAGTPEEGMTPYKARKLLELGQRYLYEHNLADVGWRVDLVAVELDKQGKWLRTNHIPNAAPLW